MTVKLPYWHVDAFADAPFKGNQAAVMPLTEWLPDDVLQAIGEENNFAETAFVVPDATGEADYELRWFTPTLEIELCGHATLASGHVLMGQLIEGGQSHAGKDRIRFRTRKAGILEVLRKGDAYEVGLPAIPTKEGAFDEAVSLLGAQPKEVWQNPGRYNIFLYDSEAEIRALKPDFKGLGALGDDQFACTAPGDKTDIVSRVFVPGAGVNEDSVTGSAHAVLTPFWANRLARDQFTAHQASERGGELTCRLEGDGANGRAWLGGQCVTVVEGSFYLTG